MLAGGKNSDEEMTFLQAGVKISAPPALKVSLLGRHGTVKGHAYS
jgi:hypothetical protein